MPLTKYGIQLGKCTASYISGEPEQVNEVAIVCAQPCATQTRLSGSLLYSLKDYNDKHMHGQLHDWCLL